MDVVFSRTCFVLLFEKRKFVFLVAPYELLEDIEESFVFDVEQKKSEGHQNHQIIVKQYILAKTDTPVSFKSMYVYANNYKHDEEKRNGNCRF